MPKTRTKTKKQPPAVKLPVRTRIWGAPKVEYRDRTGKWIVATDLAECRTVAAQRGFSGISVTPV